MVHRQSVVGISGSVTRPSRTTALVTTIVEAIGARGDLDVEMIELADAAPHVFKALTPWQIEGEARRVIDLIENADILVVGTPVYRASMSGALKHVFDLVDHRKFTGKPVALAATGGSLMHGLMLEHQLRPLFGFLNALTLPTTVYATEADFDDYRIVSHRIGDRVARVAEEAAMQLGLAPLTTHRHRDQALA